MKYSELLRPQIHYSPLRNWMNDPNGCVYFQGEYHLYYQYHPFDSNWGPMHWGHAVSDDLIHWNEKNIAISPDDKLGMVFSGSIVVDENNVSGFFNETPGLVAFFTSHIDFNDAPGGFEQQSLAYSSDNGNTWHYFKGNPVIANPGLLNFRDPKVFYHKESSAWIMVVVAGYEVMFYRSANLIDWEFSSKFGKGYGINDKLWECPDLLHFKTSMMQDIWILIVSCQNREMPENSAVQYFIGDFDGYQFTSYDRPDRIRLFDYGCDFYATHSWHGIPETDSRQIWIGWVNNWAYANDIPTKPWRGVMSLPRSLSLGERDGNFYLKQLPISEIHSLIKESNRIDICRKRNCLIRMKSDYTHELECEIQTGISGSVSFDFIYGNDERLKLILNGELGEIVLDKSNLTLSDFHPKYNPITRVSIPKTDQINIRIIIDRSIIEVFINEGEYVFTSQIFPSSLLNSLEYSTKGEISTISMIYNILGPIWSELNRDIAHLGFNK